MLVQVALIIFALFGLLSLVVDVGFMRLTQAQLQNAADSAAVEGLRRRDVTVQNAAGQAVRDPYASDCLRRAAAGRMVRRTFDDDFNAANGDDLQFGGGPVIGLSEGVTSLHALQTIAAPVAHSYKPELQFNQGNVGYGDMVSGRFCYTEDPKAAEGADALAQELVCTEEQRGVGAYARTDFNPNGTSPEPPTAISECPGLDEELPDPWPTGGTGSLTTVDDSAFLVRLRRSPEFDGVQIEPGVASSGPALPLLFGRGATVMSNEGPYSPRRDGFTVRATAIADARPALQVGLPQANQLGVTPFALVDTYAANLPVTAVQVTIDPASGLICNGLVCTAVTPSIGRFIDALTDATRAAWVGVSTVGNALTAARPLNCAAIGTRTGYVPVYSAITGDTTRIIGFTRIALNPDPARAANTCAKVIVRSASLVAPDNASAVLTNRLALPVTATAAQVRELFEKQRVAVGRLDYQPVLAPALAR